METFKIEIQEYHSRVIEIQAESSSDAISIANEMYKNSDIVLNYDDFAAVEFIDINNQNKNDEKTLLINELIEYLFEDEKKHFEESEPEPENHIYKKILRLKDLTSTSFRAQS